MSTTAFALNGLVAVPVAFALLAALLRRSERAAVTVAFVGSLAALGWSLWVAMLSRSGLEANRVDQDWIAAIDVSWSLGVDGISAPLLVMTALIGACCFVSLFRHAPACGGQGNLAALLLLIEAGCLGCFLALDMVLFFVFFEVALIPMWFVINSWGDEHDEPGRRRAATRFLVFTVLGSALMLVGFMLVRSIAGTFDITEVARQADGAAYDLGSPTAVLASVLVGLGLAVKTPLWPLHIWLPDAHSKAPTVGSVLLAAVLLKLGAYGFVRFWLPVTDPTWELLVPLVAALAVVAIVYAALACLVQTDLKRLIAYSSVGHMGFVVLAVATFTEAGVQAAVYASVAHGVITGLLFFLAGAIKDRHGTADLDRLRVLYGKVPRLAGVFAFAAMASMGLPGLAGFWGEMLAIRSAVDQSPALPESTFAVLAVLAAVGVILTSAYFLVLLRAMAQGVPGDRLGADAADIADVDALEWLAWAPLLALTVLLGVMPGLLLSPVAEASRAFFGGA